LLPALLRRLSHHKCFQCQPMRILLRGELLASTVMVITTSLFGERMFEQLALQEAGHSHPLDQLEVHARLLFVPGRAPRRERHQFERRVVERMANNASRVALTPGKKDGLHLGLEELVIQRLRCGGGRSWLAPSLLRRDGRCHEQTCGDDRIRRGPLHANLR
jgi:hypothetical protein